MKARTIKAVISKKIEDWISSIDDPAVQELVSKNTIVTGGCIASMLLCEPVNDFDVYFRNRETTLAVANYYIHHFAPQQKHGIDCNARVDDSQDDRVRIIIQSAGVASETGTSKPYEYFESRPEGEATAYVGDVFSDPGDIQDKADEITEQTRQNDEGKPPYRPVFISTNAITLSGKIQLVMRFYGEPEQIHENYDFAHCTNYWTSWDKQLVLKPAALEALLTRELIYTGSRYPVASIVRMRKFIQRGWKINAGQMLKAIMQISALDLTDIKVLQDQLTGVDCAYFTQVLSQLKDKDPVKVNTAYLIEIIDRMF